MVCRPAEWPVGARLATAVAGLQFEGIKIDIDRIGTIRYDDSKKKPSEDALHLGSPAMIQRRKETLIVSPTLVLTDGTRSQDTTSTCDGQHSFTFDLCRKSATFGEVVADQWWMPLPTVYGQRKRSANNGRKVVDFYWQRCTQGETASEVDAQDTFILANLLPFARSNGSRRVFADALLTRRRQSGADLLTVAAELEELLRADPQRELTKFDFQRHTANVLGPPEYDTEVRECYTEFEAQLLGTAREALQHNRETGLQVAIDQWDSWTSSIGRRVGNQLQKQILDVLSYECRAALHTCYSAVWFDLVQHLEAKWEMSAESVLFHRLWHLDLLDNVGDPSLPNNRLFHGHIFGLHPACANFIQTRTGGELMGQFLVDPGCQPNFRRLLNGLLIAMHDYATRNGVYALLRKKQPDFVTGEDLVGLEEEQAERRTGRRRAKSSNSDSR